MPKEKFLPIKLPPGLYKQGTEYQAKGRWHTSDHVRFYEDTVRPIGGYRRLLDSAGVELAAVSGCPRAMMVYRGDGGAVRVAVGTTTKAYVVTEGALVDITPGDLTTGACTGTYEDGSGVYGNGDYGAGPYGGISLASTLVDADTWTLDSFGDFLVGVLTSDGRLLSWDGDSMNDFAEVDATAPINNRAVVVTPERFLVALGANGNPRLVKWASQETVDTWTEADDNTAGEFPLSTPGVIMAGKRTRRQTLIFTSTDLHTMTHIGGDFIYGFDEAGTKCGLLAPNAVAMADSRAYWMGWRSFFMFDGRVRKIPSEVSDYVFSDFNYTQRALVNAVTIAEFGEIWWFYPSTGSVENDRAVVYNYVEDHWATHTIERGAGVDREVTPSPIFVSNHQAGGDTGGGLLFEHETALGTKDVTPFAKTGPLELGEGDQIYRVQNIIPDENNRGDVELTISASLYPNTPAESAEVVTLAGDSPIPSRITGRQLTFSFVGNQQDDWRIGHFRLGVRPQGTR